MIRLTAPAGLRVVALPQQHLHRTALVYAVRIGSRFERAATAGLSHFLEHMLHRGTRSHPTAHEQALAIEGIGGSLDAATGVDRGTMTLTCPPSSFAEAATLLGEVAIAPVFSDVDIERGIVREELFEDRDERGRVVDPDTVLREALFGEHPLGLPIGGSPQTLATFDVPMLARHHARHYTSSSAVVALAGRLPGRSRLAAVLGRAFRGHRRGAPVREPAFRRTTVRSRFRTVRTSSSHVSVRIGCVGPGRGSRGEPAAELLLRVVDDGTSTRLYERLCDRLGLCYEVSAGWEAYADVGLFDLAAEAQDEAVPRVLEELFALLGELARAGASPGEVEGAKRRALWQAERSHDQPESTAEELALSALAGSPRSPFERYRRLAAVGAPEIAAVAGAMFDPRRVAVALIGPVSKRTERRARALALGE